MKTGAIIMPLLIGFKVVFALLLPRKVQINAQTKIVS